MNNLTQYGANANVFLFSKQMGGQFDLSVVGDNEIGDNFSLQGKTVTGFRLVTENDVNGVINAVPGSTLITDANLKGIGFSFWDDKSESFVHSNIPAAAFIFGRASDAKKGYFYEVDLPAFNLGKSIVHVFKALPALPAGSFYTLQLLISFK